MKITLFVLATIASAASINAAPHDAYPTGSKEPCETPTPPGNVEYTPPKTYEAPPPSNTDYTPPKTYDTPPPAPPANTDYTPPKTYEAPPPKNVDYTPPAPTTPVDTPCETPTHSYDTPPTGVKSAEYSPPSATTPCDEGVKSYENDVASTSVYGTATMRKGYYGPTPTAPAPGYNSGSFGSYGTHSSVESLSKDNAASKDSRASLVAIVMVVGAGILAF